jgi:demethylmenaquinone methyltransferase/2-methoxy-6-polyprenyl-1,4-benzoquinol methylase
MRAPHPPLKDYYAEAADRGDWVRALFDRTAGDYDRLERAMAFGTGPWYRERALRRAGLERGQRVIDVGVGTGLTASAAARIVGDPVLVVGVDPSAGMIACAKVPEGLRLYSGHAEAIPLAAASADFLSMGYALRHVENFTGALQEFLRVLAPGGRLCLLEITLPSGKRARAVLRAYLRGVVPLLARVLGRHRDSPALMHYLWDTIAACAPPDAILAALREAGFEEVRRHVELGIFSEYCAHKAPAPARDAAGAGTGA